MRPALVVRIVDHIEKRLPRLVAAMQARVVCQRQADGLEDSVGQPQPGRLHAAEGPRPGDDISPALQPELLERIPAPGDVTFDPLQSDADWLARVVDSPEHPLLVAALEFAECRRILGGELTCGRRGRVPGVVVGGEPVLAARATWVRVGRLGVALVKPERPSAVGGGDGQSFDGFGLSGILGEDHPHGPPAGEAQVDWEGPFACPHAQVTLDGLLAVEPEPDSATARGQCGGEQVVGLALQGGAGLKVPPQRRCIELEVICRLRDRSAGRTPAGSGLLEGLEGGGGHAQREGDEHGDAWFHEEVFR